MDRLTTVVSYGILLLLAYLVFLVFEPFLLPLAWAGILVVFFHPFYKRLLKRMTPLKAALACTLVVTVLLIVPTMLLLSLFVREAFSVTAVVQRAVLENPSAPLTRLSDWLHQHVRFSSGYDLPTLLQQGAERLGAFLALQVVPVLRNMAAFLFDFCVVVFAMAYFFRDSERLVKALRQLLPFEPAHRDRILDESRDLIVGSVLVTLVVAGIQGTLGGAAFGLVGLPGPFFWGVVMAFFSLVPVVGTALVWVPAALWLGWTGHWGRAVILALVCAGVVGAADNILRPILLRGHTQLNGLLVFISVFGGVHVFGLLGIVLGPIVVATVVSLLEVQGRAAGETADG